MLKRRLKNIIHGIRFFLYAHCRSWMRLWLSLTWWPSPTQPEYYLRKILAKKKDVYFIQIGANDGLVNDPLIRLISLYNWHGVLLEPLSTVFYNQLKPLHYKYQQLIPVHAAITPSKETIQLYSLSFSQKRWATGLSTFRKEVLEEKIRSGYVSRMAKKYGDLLPIDKQEWIVSETIQTIDFITLISTYNLTNVDLLQIDTEGLDAEIIRLFPFHIYKPQVISFEHENFSESERKTCFLYLEQLGYSMIILERDALAIA